MVGVGGWGGGETDKTNRENFQRLQFYFKPNNLQTELTTNGDAHIALFLKHLECNAVSPITNAKNTSRLDLVKCQNYVFWLGEDPWTLQYISGEDMWSIEKVDKSYSQQVLAWQRFTFEMCLKV